MKIQEFACETAPQSEEFTDEAKALCEKLGALGQETFYGVENASPCPYRKMTKQEFAVYKTVLPVRETIDKFDAGPIPLRVLQIGAHAMELLPGTLVVWHAGVGKDDPLLTLRQGSEYNGEYYLLARWADELEEFSVLMKRAVDAGVDELMREIAKIEQEITAWKASASSAIASRLREGKTDMPSIHWW